MKKLILIISLLISSFAFGTEGGEASKGNPEVHQPDMTLTDPSVFQKLCLIMGWTEKEGMFDPVDSKRAIADMLLTKKEIMEDKRIFVRILTPGSCELIWEGLIEPETSIGKLRSKLPKDINFIELYQDAGCEKEKLIKEDYILKDQEVIYGMTLPKGISYEICGVTFEFVRVDQANGSYLYFEKYPVTHEQWQAVMGINPSYHNIRDIKCPVEEVSYNDIVTGFLPKLNGEGQSYRLPTKEEWEYAAYAGKKTTWPWGDDESRLGEFAWYGANSGWTTHPVGKKLPNAFGLYDMLGNVWEWTSSLWSEENGGRIFRGGSCYHGSRYLRPAQHYVRIPDDCRSEDVGFRLVMEKK